MLEPFQLPYVQRGLLEVLILAVPGGLLGTWIVLRGLGFFAHAVGTATFPGLVLAAGLGFAAPLGAFGAAMLFAGGTVLLRRGRSSGDAAVALVLAGSLATGVVLASDVFGSGSSVDTLLFGSLLLVDGGDIALAALAAAAALLATVLVGRRWLAAGFEPGFASQAGSGERVLDAALIGLIALGATAVLTVVGALLVAAVFVVPAVTTRLVTERMRTWQLASVALVAAQGVAGLWLSVKTDAPPGATIACVAGGTFAAVAIGRALLRAPRRAAAAASLITLLALVAGCGDGSSDGGEERPKVMATTTQIADFARQVGGEAVDVEQLLEPNSDPHEYEPRPSDVEAVAGADLVFANGDGLDNWIGEVVSDSGSDAELVDLGAVVPVRLEGEGEGDASGRDPHWWHDPRNAAAAVGEIERRLGGAEPGRKAAFARNANAYLARLRSLDRRISRCIGPIPAARRKMVTDHDALGYFANRYGIEVVGAVVPSQTTGAQTSAKDLRDLAATIEDEGVQAVFPESSVSADAAEAIASQTGASVEHTLYGDSLGPEGSDGDTYLTMEAANADAVVHGLSGGRRGCRASR